MSSIPAEITSPPSLPRNFNGKVNDVRFSREFLFADQLAAACFRTAGKLPELPSAELIRRRLLTSHVRLSENMAPEVFAHARRATTALALVEKPLELYQAAGEENAANWTCAEVIFVSFQGKMISLLDEEAFVALLGHEFGHHLAHTAGFENSRQEAAIRFAGGMAYDTRLPDKIRVMASRVAMGQEFTADRFAALATGSLSGPLRLMMSIVTGLPAERLKADEESYIAQAKALFEEMETAATHTLGTHPEHLLRAYALALFAESDVFQKLTGSGPGTRPLEEVDAALEKILTGSDEQIFETNQDAVLPPEVQEFSLMAAMLVAAADDEINDSEVRALEETFAEALPDWKEFLHDPERALKRFEELLPLMITGGVPVASSVFNVLVHVMLCDEEVHVRELEMLSSVGRSLRQQALFDYLLSAVARTLRVERSQQPYERPLPALPPGRHEAQAAMEALFAGMARRGGGTVTLSRLLRILGLKTWQPELLASIERTAKAHELEIAAPPQSADNGSVPLDQPLLFRLNEKELARREAAAIKPGADSLAQATTRDALLVALKHLREKLVSGDGRSPSVRLYRVVSGRHFDLAQLDRVIAGRSERIAAMLHDKNSIPLLGGEEAAVGKTAADMARTVRTLDREFRARVEETGAVDFHVGYPFLVGKAAGFFVRAPLILHPFSLSGESRGAGGYMLKRRDDEPAMANQALLRLLFAKKGAPFTEELANTLDEKAAEGCELLLEALRHLGIDARPLSGSVLPFEEMNAAAAELLPEGLALAENAVIGFFPQSNSDLLQDYDELLSKLDSSTPQNLETALNAACDMLPVLHRPVFTAPEISTDGDQPVIYADPSQRAAVLRARSARLLVVDGPPGTGKSQTIVNLVADTLARGGKVAVICEKRVALDVVKQRLEAAGLGHLATVVHDVQDDRKSLYQHIADRLESPDRRSFSPLRLRQLRTEAAQIEQHLKARQQWLVFPTAAGLTVGQLHSMAAAFSVSTGVIAGLESLDQTALKQLRLHLTELHGYAPLLGVSNPYRTASGAPARASLARATPETLAAIGQQLRAATGTTQAYHAAYAAQPLDPGALAASEVSLTQAADFAQAAQASPQPELPARLLHARSQPGLAAELEDHFAQIETHRAAAEAEKSRVQSEATPALTGAIVIARAKCRSFFKFLSSDWRKASALIRDHLLREWPEQAAAKITPELLASLDRRAKASLAWNAAEQLFRALHMPSALPRQADELYQRLAEMLALWHSAARFTQAKPALATLKLWPLAEETGLPTEDWPRWAAKCQAASQLLALQRACHAAVLKAAETFPQAATHTLDQLRALSDAFARDAAQLAALDRSLEQAAAVFPAIPALAETLADAFPDQPASTWTDAATRAWAESHLAHVASAQPGITLLAEPVPLGSTEQASACLLEIHQAIAREESLRLAAAGDGAGLMAVSAAEARARRTPEQTTRETLIRECRKQRNVTPMRTLVRRTAAQGLLDVVPIWLMSPETTAILFPRQPVFDLLIIDEASQCTVENGLPVLTRARQAVIAGDDKQMPPSSFFKAGAGLDTTGLSDAEEEPEVATDAFDAESLLVLARQGSESAPLRWHYRALFEELIAFSNHSMYGGSLLTIPAVHSRSATPALQWVRLENGTWEKGVNQPEAAKIVDLIHQLLSRPKPPSVGVVTFNLVQRRAIMDEIDQRRATDPAFTALYDAAASAESLDARPFVKNLESVQGDERDVIIFSLGYAPVPRKKKDGTEETYVPARFGPLGQKGGERRLNVAVSRAKAEIIVVSSFDPAMLSVAKSKNDGPRLFKAFVEFARHLGEGRRHQAEKVLTLVNDTRQTARLHSKTETDPLCLPLHHQITLALEAAGHAVEAQIGTSEFRLPVAIVQRGDNHRYALAILCDDGSKAADIYEEFVHIPNVLAHRKWNYLRINSHDWHRDHEGVMKRIKKALAAA